MFGLSFCGILSKNAAAKSTALTYYVTDDFGTKRHIETEVDIYGDVASLVCTKNNKGLTITTDAAVEKTLLNLDFEKDDKDPSNNAACDETLKSLIQQFNKNDVRVAAHGRIFTFNLPNASGSGTEFVYAGHRSAGSVQQGKITVEDASVQVGSGATVAGVKLTNEDGKAWTVFLSSGTVISALKDSGFTVDNQVDPSDGSDPSVPITGTPPSFRPTGSFLGMHAWYDGLVDGSGNFLQVTDDGSKGIRLSEFIWTIAANVAIDMAVIAAFAAIGFVLYGGYLYMFSGGDTGKVSSGKKTITNAIIGLAIAMLAKVIFTTLKHVFAASVVEVDVDGQTVKLANADPGIVATDLISWVGGVAGIICVIFLVYGGVSYMTSSGDASKTTKAKNAILYSLIGLAIVGLAEVITATVANTIRDAQNVSQIETTQIIAKEENEKQIN